MKTPGCLESDLQAPESPHSHKAHDKLAHSPEDGPSALTDARVEKVAIRESAEQDSVRQFLVQPRYISTTFHLRLRTWDRDPILVRNVNGSDTVYDLKMKIQYQHGIPLHLQEVCLPERNLHDGTASNMICMAVFTNIDQNETKRFSFSMAWHQWNHKRSALTLSPRPGGSRLFRQVLFPVHRKIREIGQTTAFNGHLSWRTCHAEFHPGFPPGTME